MCRGIYKGQNILNNLDDITCRPMDIYYEEYANLYNWCLHKNPIGMPEEDRKQFYLDVDSMPFDKMAEKDLSRIKKERKRRKISAK